MEAKKKLVNIHVHSNLSLYYFPFQETGNVDSMEICIIIAYKIAPSKDC